MRHHGRIGAAVLAAIVLAAAPPAAVAQVSVNIRVGPPPLRAEAVPPPRRGYVWDRGHWGWAGGQYAWVAGHWIPDRPGWRWVPGAWGNGPGGWRWGEGHWVR
jgi:hypothetical protein